MSHYECTSKQSFCSYCQTGALLFGIKQQLEAEAELMKKLEESMGVQLAPPSVLPQYNDNSVTRITGENIIDEELSWDIRKYDHAIYTASVYRDIANLLNTLHSYGQKGDKNWPSPAEVNTAISLANTSHSKNLVKAEDYKELLKIFETTRKLDKNGKETETKQLPTDETLNNIINQFKDYRKLGTLLENFRSYLRNYKIDPNRCNDCNAAANCGQCHCHDCGQGCSECCMYGGSNAGAGCHTHEGPGTGCGDWSW